jgi:hypothetical protein
MARQTYRTILGIAVAALAAALLPTSASAERRPAMKSCGDTTAGNGLLVGDITARRVSCRKARRIARATPARCGTSGNCRVRGYTCFTAQAAEELRFARCSKAEDGDELYRTIRFDFGS